MGSKQTKKDRAKSSATKAAGVAGQNGIARAKNAKLASEAIKASHAKQVKEAASTGDFVRKRAGEVAESTKAAAATGVRSGAREQVKGHLIEGMTIRDYNAAGKLAGKRLEGMRNGTHPAYDARKFLKVDGKAQFAGAVQVKSSAAGVEKAIAQIEKAKVGSAKNATLYVPDDQVAEATRRAAGRIRVKGNGVTRAQATKRLDKGVKALADEGLSATSVAKAAGKAGALGAAINVGIGAVGDAKAVKNGELNGRHFTENRLIDAGEGAVGGALGAAGASVASAGAGVAIANTAVGASIATGAGTAGTAVLGAVGSLGSGGAAVATAASALSAPVVLPAVAGVGAAVAIGFGVSKLANVVRGKVEESRTSANQEDGEAVSERSRLVVRKQARLRTLCKQHEDRRRRGDCDSERMQRFEATITALDEEIRALVA